MIEGQRMAVAVAVLLTMLPASLGAHKKEPHDEDKTSMPPSIASEATTTIAAIYEATVWPIFRRSCADCHGTATEMPWYYSIPGVRQLIDRDIREAREHLDMRDGFPFGGHGTPPEDLKAIAKALRDESMPPLRYRLMHGDAALTEAESETVLNWANESLRLLEPEQTEDPPVGGHGTSG